MKEYLAILLVFLVHASDAHHNVHLIPAHKICPNVTGDQDILLPDPRDCAVYYRCENGAAVPQSCPTGLHWCQILQHCTLPVYANCTITHVPVTYSPEELVTWHPGPQPGVETCPNNGEAIPDAGDCCKYKECVDGHPKEQHCPGNERFNTWLGICTAAEISNCIDIGSQENKTCPKNGVKKIYPTDCNKYYECIDNKVEIKQCPENLEYNEWFQDCYSSNVAFCHTYTTVTPTIPTTINTPSPVEDLCPGEGFTLPNPLNCTTYFFCKGSTSTLEKCPEGYYYSCWDQQCLPPSDGSCLASEGQNCTESGQTLPHSDCSSYYECVNGKTQEVKCKEGLQYNAWFAKCVNPSLAHCKSETTTVTTVTHPSVTSSPSSTEDNCPFEGAQLPDPLDCHYFFTCIHSTPVRQKCPSNYEYSCWDQECLSPESANCVNNAKPGQACKENEDKLPNTNDCSSYYECKNGTVVQKHCDSDLEYNAWFKKCTEVSRSHCRYTTTHSSVTPTGPEVTTLPSVTPTGPEVTTLPSHTPTGPEVTTLPSHTPTGPEVTTLPSVTPTGPEVTTLPSHTPTGPEVTTLPSVTPTGPEVTTLPSHTPTGPEVTTLPSVTPTGPEVTTLPSHTPTGPEVTTLPSVTPTGPEVTTLPSHTPTGPEVTTLPSVTPTGPEVTTLPSHTPTGPEVTTLPSVTPTGPEVTTLPSHTPTGPEVTTLPSHTPTGPEVTTLPSHTPTGPEVTTLPSVTPTGPEVTTLPSHTPTGPEVTTLPSHTPTGPEVTTLPSHTPTGPEVTTLPSVTPTGPEVTTLPSHTPTGPEVTTLPSVTPTGPEVTTLPSHTPTGPEVTTLPSHTPTGPEVTTLPSVTPTGPEVTTLPSHTPTGPEVTTLPSVTPTGPEVTTLPSDKPTGPTRPPSIFCSKPDLMYPSVTECNQYMKCDKDRQLQTYTCDPPEFHYNCETKTCQNITHCCASHTRTPTPTTPSIPTTPTPSPTTTPDTTTPTPPTNLTPPPPGTCPIGDAKLPNPLDCTSYYICKNGEIVSERCQAGLIYSCWDQTCESPVDGSCINEGNLVGHKCSDIGSKLPDITDCSKYYKCVNGTVEIDTCVSGTIYNKWLKTCISAKLDTCTTYSTVTVSPTTPGSTLPSSPNPEYNVCPIEGSLLPNPLDCSTYYECNKGVPTLQNCPGGMEYSCWDQQCENDTNANCVAKGAQNGNNCTVEGLRITDVSHCDNYYECINGIIVLKECPPGEEFNSAFQKCYKPTLAHCVTNTPLPPVTQTSPSPTPNAHNDTCPYDGALLPNPLNCSAYYKCINGTPTPQLCADGNEYSCWNQECEPAGEAQCISQGNQSGIKCKYPGERIQNPLNCQTYYECVKGKVELKTCPFNWYYNKWFKFCTPLKSISHCKEITTPVTPRPTPTPTTKGPETGKDICPLEGALLPDPLDCTSYYTCENNNVVSQKCPSGKKYSCWDQQCENSADAQCISSGIQEGQNCSRDGVKLQNPDSCASYYECKNGKTQKNYCFIGFQYNRWYQKCVLFLYSHCKTFTTVTPTPTNTPTPTTVKISTPSVSYDLCPEDGALLPNPVDCTKFYICQNNTPTIESCPDGQEYSCWDQKCENDTDANCIAGSQAGAHCTIDGLKLTKIDNCSNYYECVNGSVVEKQCESGQQFNDRFKECVAPDRSHCSPHPTSPPPSPSVSPVTKPNPKTDICPKEGTLIPNPLNCSTYYKCINGTPTPELCADGYEYSCWNEECEPADKAQCIADSPTSQNSCVQNGQKNPDITNCHRYLECENNKITTKTCLLNWYYNKWFKFCVPLESLAHCNQTTTLAPETTRVTTPTPKPSPVGDVCPINKQTLPDPTDCTKYLECVANKQTSKSCPKDQKYSAWDQKCKKASEVKCYNIGSQSGQNCSRGGVTLQNLQSCTSYLKCESGIVQDHYCSIGFSYNRWYQECQGASVSHCKTYPTIAPPTTTANPVTGKWYLFSYCPKNGLKAPNIDDCNTYYVCSEYHAVLYNCPPGSNYDSWSQSCEPVSSARCVTTPQSWVGQSCTKDGDTVPDPKSCSNYYTCKGHKIQANSCPYSFFSTQNYGVWDRKCKAFATCASRIVL